MYPQSDEDYVLVTKLEELFNTTRKALIARVDHYNILFTRYSFSYVPNPELHKDLDVLSSTHNVIESKVTNGYSIAKQLVKYVWYVHSHGVPPSIQLLILPYYRVDGVPPILMPFLTPDTLPNEVVPFALKTVDAFMDDYTAKARAILVCAKLDFGTKGVGDVNFDGTTRTTGD